MTFNEGSGDWYQPEQQLLIQSAKSNFGDTSGFSRFADGSIDFETAASLARRHGVVQQLSNALNEHLDDVVPLDILSGLQEQSEAVTQQNLHFTTELLELITAVRRRDIPIISYRGPVLASVGYGSLGLRQFKDLDFLVHQSDIPAVKEILEQHGYQPVYKLPKTDTLTNVQEHAYTNYCRDYPFHKHDGTEVELHWRVISRNFPTNLTLDTFWDRRDTTSINGTTIPVLSTEDRVLMLCVHGSRHKWERLEWIVDLAEVLSRHTVDWEYIWWMADAHNCKRMVALGPLIAHDLFDIDIPLPVQRFTETDPKIEKLREKRHRILFDSPTEGKFESHLEQSELLDRRRDKLRFWLWWGFSPERESIERVALPASLDSFYRILRVFRLLELAGQRAKSD